LNECPDKRRGIDVPICVSRYEPVDEVHSVFEMESPRSMPVVSRVRA
jgi:hypothetical protein